MKLRPWIMMMVLLALAACKKIDKPVTPGEEPGDEPGPEVVETRDLTLSFSISKPNIYMEDGKTSVRVYWQDGTKMRIYSGTDGYSTLDCTAEGSARSASFAGTIKVAADKVELRGVHPEVFEIGTYQTPKNSSCDPAYDFVVMMPRSVDVTGLTELELAGPIFNRLLSYAVLKFGNGFSKYADDTIRYIEIVGAENSSPMAGKFSLSGLDKFSRVEDIKLSKPEARTSTRTLTLDCRDAAMKLNNAEVWAVMFDGQHDIDRITVSTDKRDIILSSRKLTLKAGYATELLLELGGSDKVDEYAPAIPAATGMLMHHTDCTMGAPSSKDNFLCLANGHSYSPYTLRYLDPFTLSSSNPNGWTTSSSNKLEGEPKLTEEQYLSVQPYIMFHPSANSIYGPASKYTIMMTYSYDAFLHVNQYGTPALTFRRLESSGAASDETTVAKWVRSAALASIATTKDGNVTVKNTSSSSITRNFKVDKSTVTYSTSSTNRDYFKIGDVIMIQWLGRYGNVTDKEYLRSGFIHVKSMQTDEFNSMSRLVVDVYWEN